MNKNLLKKILSITSFAIAGTNFGNALYAYQSGPYGKRKGYLDANTNSFVVWSNSTFSVIASIVFVFYSFKK